LGGPGYFKEIGFTELCGMNNNIKGKVIAITGASSGIGEAIAILLAAKGAKVVLGARRADRLDALVKRIEAAGGEAVYRVTDIKQRDDLVRLVDLACGTFGRLDVMVNNAGISHLARIDEVQVEDWEEMIDVNLKGTLYGIAAALPVFKKQGSGHIEGSGHIINIISTAGIKIVPLQGVYAATKNAVRTITEALRQESGGQYRVTGISPADIAGAVAYAVGQPDNVDVGDIVIRPAAQD
jgi:NADP-dependent 3-hydroxy acid dehydrogenase YdfG